MFDDLKKYLKHRSFGRVSFVLFVLFAVIGMVVAGTILESRASRDRVQAVRDLELYAASWQTRINAGIREAIGLATSIAAFAQGAATAVPNHNGTLAERKIQLNVAGWNRTAAELFKRVPGVYCVSLEPSGVITQIYPPEARNLIGIDYLNGKAYREGYLKFIAAGQPQVTGPREIAKSFMLLQARYPVYLDARKRFEDYWGAGSVWMIVKTFFQTFNMTTAFGKDGYGFATYTLRVGSPNRSIALASINTTTDDRWLSSSVVTVPIATGDPEYSLWLAVFPLKPLPSGEPMVGDTALIMFYAALSAFGFIVTLLITILIGRAAGHRLVPHTSSKPQATAMALVSVQDMAWWSEKQEPAQLQDDLKRFEKAVGKSAVRHGCYPCGRVADGCVLVVASSVDRIRSFSLDARLALEEHLEGAFRGAKSKDTDKTHTTEKTQGTQVQQKKFRCGIAMHVGNLRAAYDARIDAYEFHGEGITETAFAVDATKAREVTATDAFVEHDTSLGAGKSLVARDLDDEHTLWIVMRDTDELQDGESSSSTNANAATGISAKLGTAIRKRIAVLVIEVFPKTASVGQTRALPAALLQSVERVLGAVRELQGEVISLVDGRLTVIFNGLTTVSRPARRAVLVDIAIRQLLPSSSPTSVVTHGSAYVSCLGQLLMVTGDAMTRADELYYAVASQAHVRLPLTRTVVTDDITSLELKHCCELQCLGTLQVDSLAVESAALVYSVEKLWEDDENQDADEEWLYRVEKRETQSVYAPLNMAFEKLRLGDSDSAEKFLRAVGDSASADASSYDEHALSALREMCLSHSSRSSRCVD
jgi:sensor domain CHASE-containing protein